MGRKVGGVAVSLSIGQELGTHVTQCRLGRGLQRTKWYPDPPSRLATIGMGRDVGDRLLRHFPLGVGAGSTC